MALAAGFLLNGCVTVGAASQSAVLRAKDRVAPALVHIRPVKEIYSQGKREEFVVIGSGCIISPDGYVVTNEHVAGESNFVHCVLSDKTEVEAKVVGVDPYTDIAVLKLDTGYPLPYVKLGTSSDLKAGETVLALGSPHGLARSISQGIVSVTDRYLEDHGDMVSPFNNWIQTDAAINPGNSGGPLVNLRGEVIGVNARAMRGAENVGFAIPIDVVKEVVDAIIAEGRVPRSTLGITLQEMLAKTDDSTQAGVIIADVDPLSAGSEAGLLAGDVLLAVEGQPANARFEEDLPRVRKLIADYPVGSELKLRLLRGNEEIEIAATTEEISQVKGNEVEFAKWAFTASELTPEVVRRAQLPSRQGVLISGAQVGGPAGVAGLQQGDIILAVDNEDVEDLSHFTRIYNKCLEDVERKVLLWVKRGALTRFVLVKQQNGAAETAIEEEGNTVDAE